MSEKTGVDNKKFETLAKRQNRKVNVVNNDKNKNKGYRPFGPVNDADEIERIDNLFWMLLKSVDKKYHDNLRSRIDFDPNLREEVEKVKEELRQAEKIARNTSASHAWVDCFPKLAEILSSKEKELVCSRESSDSKSTLNK